MVTENRKRKPHGTNPSLQAVELSAVQKAVSNVSPLMKCQKVDPSKPQEVQKRLEDYFNHCQNASVIPSIESMSLYLGVTRKTLWRWANGNDCPFETSNIVRRAKDILSAIDAELVLTGKINPVSYIFRSKNFYEMQDAVQIQTAESEPVRDIDEIASRYENVVMVDASDKYLDNRDG